MSRHYSDRNLSIRVDTSVVVTRGIEYYSEKSYPMPDSVRSYYAYLVTIKNISDSVIWMGKTFSVFFMHMELKDKNGHWKEASRDLSEAGLCLTIEPSIYLRPGEILISKVPVLKGTCSTEARLAFGGRRGRVYSNTFRQGKTIIVNGSMYANTITGSALIPYQVFYVG
jgi:hypothetical protein